MIMQGIEYYPMRVLRNRESGYDYRNHLHVGQYFSITSICKFLFYASFNPMNDISKRTAERIHDIPTKTSSLNNATH